MISSERTPLTDRDRYLTGDHYRGGGCISTDDAAMSLNVHAELHVRATARLAYGVFSPACPDLAAVYRPYGRCVAIIDDTVFRLYGKMIRAYFADHGIDMTALPYRAQEADKSVASVERILDYIGPSGRDVTRDEPVLVIGGGVLSDVAGLACALLNRRTPYVAIPTNVLTAVDAGPSPRVCANTPGLKNTVGAFHSPILTLIDRSFFGTLPYRHVRNGLAEVLKMAIVDDAELFALLEEHGSDLVTSRLASAPGTVRAETEDLIIYRAVRSYMRHEGPNMFEVYQDRPHAFGHTWTPRYELAARLLHGHAVSTEMAFSATMSCLSGRISARDRDRILDAIQGLGLAIWHPAIADIDMLRDAQKMMRAKRGGRGLWAVLPTGIGSCDYAEDISVALLKETIDVHRLLCTARQNIGGIASSLG